MERLFRCAALACALALAAPAALAQSDYPTGAVKIIVANTPGTAGDNTSV